jgi:hypothetical protein
VLDAITPNVPDVQKIPSGSAFRADVPVMEGTTSAERSKVFYMKLSMHDALLGDQTEIINPYAVTHKNTLPQEPVVDQYFGPDRFTAYRAPGNAIARTLGRYLTS